MDRVDLTFPRAIPSDIIKLEEQERLERMSKGVDPILLGKHHRVQEEIVHSSRSLTGKVSASSSLEHAKEALKDTASVWSIYTTEKVGTLMEKASCWVDAAKDKLGFVGDASTFASEEKERLRRVNLKVDPLIEGRKHRMEDELLQKIKVSN